MLTLSLILAVDLAILISFAHLARLSFVRSFAAALLLVFSSLPALAQFLDRPPLPDRMFRRYCAGPQISSGAAVEQVAAITQRLGVADPRVAIVVSNSPVFNAWDAVVFGDSSLICVPVGLVHLMGVMKVSSLSSSAMRSATPPTIVSRPSVAAPVLPTNPSPALLWLFSSVMAQAMEQGTSGPVRPEPMSLDSI